MAIDTRTRRSSAINVGSPWRGILPEPDGAVGAPDRWQVANMYAGFAGGANSVSVQDVDLRAGRVYRVSGWLGHDGTTGSGAGVAIKMTPAAGQTLTVMERQGTALGATSNPDVGVPSGAAVDWTPVQFLFVPDVSGTAQLAVAFGYDNKLIGTAKYANVRCEELPPNATIGGGRAYSGFDANGGLYVPGGQSINVGTQGSPSSKTKTLRFSCFTFKPQTPSVFTPYTYGTFVAEYNIRDVGCAGAVSSNVDALLVLPKGVTITAMRVNGLMSVGLGSPASTMEFKLFRDNTSIATCTFSTYGSSSTPSASLSQLVGSERYTVVGTMQCGLCNSITFYWIEIDYTMAKYEHGY